MSLNKSTPVVWHVGRHGEVAGGMTQVINAYLNWPFENLKVEVIPSRDGSKGVKALGLYFSAMWRILRLRGRRTKDAIVVHLSQDGSFVREGSLLTLAQLLGFGVVAQLHGSRFAEFSRRYPKLVRFVLSRANYVHVLSEETRAIVAQTLAPERIVYIPNAVATGRPGDKEKLAVFGGGVTYRKGVDVLAQAWEELQAEGDVDPTLNVGAWKLVIAGPIIDAGVVPETLRNAEFVGGLSHQALMDLLDRAAIAVLPSRDEAMPMFILEALARHCCVISTPVGGIANVLSDGRGLLAPAGDIQELRRALRYAISDDDARAELAARGHASFADTFSAKVVYPKLATLWLSIVNRPRAGNLSQKRNFQGMTGE
ncbi:glycosyltransferase family 4 protein [Hahella sp. NBU794]|uniref:glycosyltransferase family 4 protein n=1 Tax=Hahella sp. NBU794 TaxID=3422590 RepID=UPI003D6E7B33